MTEKILLNLNILRFYLFKFRYICANIPERNRYNAKFVNLVHVIPVFCISINSDMKRYKVEIFPPNYISRRYMNAYRSICNIYEYLDHHIDYIYNKIYMRWWLCLFGRLRRDKRAKILLCLDLRQGEDKTLCFAKHFIWHRFFPKIERRSNYLGCPCFLPFCFFFFFFLQQSDLV